jgi:cupin superfamily acireductone dioxygenase involved in methionine salvage
MQPAPSSLIASTHSLKLSHTHPDNNTQGDQRLPHDSGSAVTPSDLQRLGVLYYRIGELSGVDALAGERGYKNRDEITVSPAKMGDAYEAKVKSFFDEHLHEDEEIRYVRDGKGYFDVRDREDRWVRIELEKVCSLLFFGSIHVPAVERGGTGLTLCGFNRMT